MEDIKQAMVTTKSNGKERRIKGVDARMADEQRTTRLKPELAHRRQHRFTGTPRYSRCHFDPDL